MKNLDSNLDGGSFYGVKKWFLIWFLIKLCNNDNRIATLKSGVDLKILTNIDWILTKKKMESIM